MATIKLLHTADVHIGARCASFGNNASKHREALKEAFGRIIDLAVDENVDVLVVAGDLFDRAFGVGEKDISFVLGELARASKLKGIVILPGSHDFWCRGSVLESNVERFEEIPNVTLLRPGCELVRFDDLSLSIRGRALVSNVSSVDLMEGLEPDPFTSFNVAVAHGSVVEGMKPTDEVDIRLTLSSVSEGFDYLALGHWHSFRDLSTGVLRAVYSGSPEPVARDQEGAGFVAMVELGQGPVKVERRRVGRIGVKRVEVDFSGIGSTDELVRMVKSAVAPDPYSIVSIGAKGFVGIDSSVDVEEALHQLEGSYHSVTLPGGPPPIEIPREIIEDVPESTVAGRFIRILLEKIDSSQGDEKRTYEEALQLGYQLFRGRNPFS